MSLQSAPLNTENEFRKDLEDSGFGGVYFENLSSNFFYCVA